MSTTAPTVVPATVPIPVLVPIASRPAVSSRAAGSRPSGGRLRLTRRGRRLARGLLWLTVTAVTALLVVLVWLGLAATVAPGAVAGDGGAGVGSGVGAAAVAAHDVRTVEVVVTPGDTLWQIARAHAPGRDPRSVVDQIVALNGLTSAGVQVGVELVVPAG